MSRVLKRRTTRVKSVRTVDLNGSMTHTDQLAKETDGIIDVFNDKATTDMTKHVIPQW